jgi:cobalt-zinc-cadmium resistance protein CzcA
LRPAPSGESPAPRRAAPGPRPGPAAPGVGRDGARPGGAPPDGAPPGGGHPDGPRTGGGDPPGDPPAGAPPGNDPPATGGLTGLVLRMRTLLFILVGLLVVGGMIDVLSLPVEAVPDISPREVLVTIVAPGLAPEEVEKLVTFPIETQMTGLPQMTDLRSISRFGVSVVYVEFADGSDINLDRTLVNERLQAARAAITAVNVVPTMGPLSTGLGEIMQFQLAGGPGHTLMELNTLMTWHVAPMLKQVAGVADLNINGGAVETFEVQLNDDALARFGISAGEVFRAVDSNNGASGGAWIEHNQEQQVIVGQGLIGSVEDLGRIVLRTGPDGTPIYVGSVATVARAPRVRLGAVTRDGSGEIVNAVVLMLEGHNSGDVARAVKAEFPTIQKTLPEGVTIRPFYDRADLTARTIATVRDNLLLGAALVLAVLLVMLGDWRAALVVTSVIPLSLLVALVGMHHLGISANLMSLGAIDFGMIVDGSVVLVENTLRRRAGRGDEPRSRTVAAAASEVARPIAFAVAIIVLVYLPVLSLQSIEGKMFRPMAETVILALLASLLLCLTWIPAFASVVIRREVREGDTWLVRQIRKPYRPALAWCEGHPWVVAGTALLLFGGSVLVARTLGGEFIPQLQEGSLVVTSQRLPSVALPTSLADTTLIERTLMRFPEVRAVVSNTGTAAIPTDPMGVNQTDSFVMLKPSSEWKTADSQAGLVAAYSKALDEAVPGEMFTWSQPIQMRMEDLLEGVRTDVAIAVYGPDLAVLADLGNQVARVVGGVQGAADTAPEQVGGLPFLHIDVDRAAAARYGVNARDVLDVVEAIGGHGGTTVVVDNAQLTTQVRFRAEDRGSIEAIRRLRVRMPSGGSVPLAQVAKISLVSGPSQISRDHVERRTVVQTNVRGRDPTSFVAAGQAAVAQQVHLPAGYRIEWSGQYQNLAQATARLSLVVPVALVLIFVLLYVTFDSGRLALLIFLNLPIAATGGIYALALRGLAFSVSAGIGFIALCGVAVLNGVVLVSYIVEQRAEGRDAVEAASQAAAIRLRPVLTTALVASLGFIPAALSTSAGAEVERPLATVVIGGLVSSTLLTLLVLPALYPWFVGEGRRRRKAQGLAEAQPAE